MYQFRIRYIFTFFLCFNVWCTCIRAQIITPLDSLESSLTAYYHSLSNADIAEYSESNKYNWLFFVPSVGYDFVGHNYMVTYNLSNIGSYAKAREANSNKVRSIEKRNMISLDNALLQLRVSYEQINNLIDRFAYDQYIIDTERELFSIYQNQYKRDEINHEEYLKHHITLMQKESALNSKRSSIEAEIHRLETLANTKIHYCL